MQALANKSSLVLRPVDVGKAVPPLVAEQVTLSEPVHRATFHFAFRYRTLRMLIIPTRYNWPY